MGKRTPGRENALRKIISCGKIERWLWSTRFGALLVGQGH
jgi:hypothetical protein